MYDGTRNEVNTLSTQYFARENDCGYKDGRDALAREVPILINERLDVIEIETNLKKPEGQARYLLFSSLKKKKSDQLK